jgi:hypothetical protein
MEEKEIELNKLNRLMSSTQAKKKKRIRNQNFAVI